MTRIARLVFDDWNITHIARHKVSQNEVEQVCLSHPLSSETYNGRIRLIGETYTGRILTIILAPKGGDSYYVVTARSASRKERSKYLESKGGEK